MIKKYIVCLSLLFPNIAFSLTGACSETPQFADYLMHKNNIIVSFNVIDQR